MSVLDEINASTSSSAINAALRSGVEAISGSQAVTFTKYVRKILPLDGFVYWVKASILGDAAPDVSIQGSLHLAMDKQQDDAATWTRVSVTFTSEQDAAQAFDAIGLEDVLIATAGGPQGATTVGEQVASGSAAGAFPVRIAFSRLGFYQNAGIFHYSGVALPAAFASQIVDDPAQLNDAPVVSSSLPAWLSLSQYVVGAPDGPFYGIGNPLPLYPAMLVPANATPPYGAIAVAGDSTTALTAVPFLDRTSSRSALTKERVKVTFYGARNDAVADFMDCVIQYSRDYDVIGLLNAPTIRDERETHAELSLLAAKKSVTFEVSYYQSSMRNIARQLIERAVPAVRPVYPKVWPSPVPA